MNLIQAVNTYVWIWLETLKSFRRPTVLLPFLIFVLVEVGLVWSSSHFYESPFGYLWVPLLSWFPGARALHYPNYFVFLPMLVSHLDLFVSAILGSLTVGWGSLLLREVYVGQPRPMGQSLGASARRYGALLLVGILVSLATYLISRLGGLLPPDLLVGYARRQLAVRILFYALTLGVQSAALYVPLSLLFNNRGLGTAFREGLSFFSQHRMMTLLLVALPFLITLPLSMALENPARVVERFKPELLLTLSFANLGVAGLASFFIAGATVRFYLYRTRQDRPATTGAAS